MKKRRREKLSQKSESAGATVEVLIERILPGGAGLAHADGQTILVGLAAPGDRLRVRLERRRGTVSFASIIEILEPSSMRVEPPCPYFGRCGGCDFQQLNYEAQLAAKAEIIRDCLRRIARLEFSGDIPVTPSPATWHYRSRAQWQYDAQKSYLGYFERGSHTVCDVVACPVISPALQATLDDLRQRMQAQTLPPYTEDFQAVAGDEGTSLFPPIEETETREVSREINGYHYRFSAEGFFQINHELLPALVDAALDDAQGATALDLYCGAGLFTLPLAQRFTRVTGIESHPRAVAYARRNLADAKMTKAVIEHAMVSEWLREHAASLTSVDFLLLDPPRTGAEEGVIESILAARPRYISYVSCDPATLARDLRGLTGGGYTLDSIAAFDMFPQTHHVETVAHLSYS
jgi:23S rRNA (uracil1939-C5)-methyltransferase